MKKYFLYTILGSLGIVLVVANTRANGQTNRSFVETVQPIQLVQAQENSLTYSEKVWLLAQIAGHYAEAGQEDKALEILAQAQPLVQFIPNQCNQSHPLARIAGQYAVIGEEVRASQILNQAIEIAQTAQGCDSSLDNLINTLEWYMDAGQYKLAIQAARGFEYPQSNWVWAKNFGLIRIAEQLAKEGRLDQAVALFDEALEIARSIDQQAPNYSSLAFIAFRNIAYFAIQAGLNDQAIEALVEVQELSQAMDKTSEKAAGSLIEIARLYGQLGQSDRAVEILVEAQELFQATKKISEKARSLIVIAGLYGQIGRSDQAVELLSLALQVAKTIEDDRSKAQVLSELARGYAKAGQYEQALAVAQMIDYEANLHNYALSDIAEQYIEDGQLDNALKVVQTISNPFKREALFNLALNQGQAGQPEQAFMLLQAMEQISVPDPGYEHEISWIQTLVAEGYAADGEFEQALMVAQTIDSQYSKAKVLIEIAEQCTIKEQYKKASEILEQALIITRTVDHQTSEVSFFVKIAEQYLANQQQEKALEILAQALMLTRSIDNKSSQAPLLIEIAEQYAVNEQQETASDVLAQALKTIQSIEPEQ